MKTSKRLPENNDNSTVTPLYRARIAVRRMVEAGTFDQFVSALPNVGKYQTLSCAPIQDLLDNDRKIRALEAQRAQLLDNAAHELLRDWTSTEMWAAHRAVQEETKNQQDNALTLTEVKARFLLSPGGLAQLVRALDYNHGRVSATTLAYCLQPGTTLSTQALDDVRDVINIMAKGGHKTLINK